MYSVGVDIIDEQHKVLIALINELDRLIQEDFVRPKVQELFRELVDYTNYHFDTEEQLMHSHHYDPDNLQKHILQHQQFRKEIDTVLSDVKHISLNDCKVILSYLTNWLVNHICKVDHHLGDYILAQQIEQEGLERRKIHEAEDATLSSTLMEQLQKNIETCEKNLPQLIESVQKLLVIVQHYECTSRTHLQREAKEQLAQLLASMPEPSLLHHESVTLIKEIESGHCRLNRMLRHFNHDHCPVAATSCESELPSTTNPKKLG